MLDEKRPLRGFGEAAKQKLLAYAWPGNVRELQNAVKHGAALAQGPEIQAGDLPDELLTQDAPAPLAQRAPAETLMTLAEAEREHILRVLDACEGSQALAARVLGIGRNTLWRKLRTFSLDGARSETHGG